MSQHSGQERAGQTQEHCGCHFLNEGHAQEAVTHRFGVSNHHSLQCGVIPEQRSQVVVPHLQQMTDSN